MKLKALVFIISFLFSIVTNAQFVRVEGIRIGFDPIRSASYLFPEKKGKDHLFYFNTLEGNLEVLCFHRVSVVSEFGLSKSHITKSYSEFDYLSKGKYIKLGLDFDLSDKEERIQTYIGWRVGLNSYIEHADLTFRSEYFGSEYKKDFGERKQKSNLWGEILFAAKYKLNKNTNNGLYIGASARFKFYNSIKYDYPSVMVPGYGFFSSYSAGLNFSLFYHFKVQRSQLKEVKYKKFIGDKNR